MMRHVLELTRHGLRVRRGALTGWVVSLTLTMFAFMAMYPSIAKMDFEKVAEQYPEGLLKAFGIESITQLGTPSGFLDMELFGAIMPLALIFLPIGMVAHLIAANEERGYMVPLLALPISRRSVMAGAAASALVAMLLAILTIIASAMLASVVVGAGLKLSDISESAMASLPLGALGAGIAAVVSGLTARRGLATGIASSVLFGMYLMQVLANFSGPFHDIRTLSVFHHYSNWINDGIAWPAFATILAIAAVLMVVGGGLFARRDVA